MLALHVFYDLTAAISNILIETMQLHSVTLISFHYTFTVAYLTQNKLKPAVSPK